MDDRSGKIRSLVSSKIPAEVGKESAAFLTFQVPASSHFEILGHPFFGHFTLTFFVDPSIHFFFFFDHPCFPLFILLFLTCLKPGCPAESTHHLTCRSRFASLIIIPVEETHSCLTAAAPWPFHQNSDAHLLGSVQRGNNDQFQTSLNHSSAKKHKLKRNGGGWREESCRKEMEMESTVNKLLRGGYHCC